MAEFCRDRVGFAFQAYNPVPYLMVRKNIMIFDTLAGRCSGSVWMWEALVGLGLESHADVVTITLSGGRQQHTALRQVLYRHPLVVFADEPIGVLDTRSVAFALVELRRLAGDGTAVILVTHDPGAVALAESVLTTRDSRIIGYRRGVVLDKLPAVVNQTGTTA